MKIFINYITPLIKAISNKFKPIEITMDKLDYFRRKRSPSIKVGLNYLSDKTEAFFISHGDMPSVSYNIYNELIKSRNEKDIIVPTYKNVQGNPVLFNKSMKEKIMSISGDVGAKKILEINKDKILKLEINDQGITKGFDSQKDFNSL